jgi:hypothetical protein
MRFETTVVTIEGFKNVAYFEVQYVGTLTYVSTIAHVTAERSLPSSKTQLRVHYVDCLPHDDSSFRAVACHRLLVAARHSACMYLSTTPNMQLDCIFVHQFVRFLLGLGPVL